MTILWFDQISAQDIERVGGKGANLGEMTRAGLPVPPGFCVTSDVYRRVIGEAGVWPQIDGLLTAVSPNNTAKTARQIQGLVA
ncbi:MAG: PEP/pyruvate-binding domain-containing protein, partial [Anaerolineae bacterium]